MLVGEFLPAHDVDDENDDYHRHDDDYHVHVDDHNYDTYDDDDWNDHLLGWRRHL